jgi:hypothetical protein
MSKSSSILRCSCAKTSCTSCKCSVNGIPCNSLCLCQQQSNIKCENILNSNPIQFNNQHNNNDSNNSLNNTLVHRTPLKSNSKSGVNSSTNDNNYNPIKNGVNNVNNSSIESSVSPYPDHIRSVISNNNIGKATPLFINASPSPLHHSILGILLWLMMLAAFAFSTVITIFPNSQLWIQNNLFDSIGNSFSRSTEKALFYSRIPTVIDNLCDKYDDNNLKYGCNNIIIPLLQSHYSPIHSPHRPAVFNLVSLTNNRGIEALFHNFSDSLSTHLFSSKNRFADISDISNCGDCIKSNVDNHMKPHPKEGIIYLNNLQSIDYNTPILQQLTDDSLAPYKFAIYIFSLFIPHQIVDEFKSSHHINNNNELYYNNLSEELVRDYLKKIWSIQPHNELIDPLLTRIVRNVILFD